MMKAKAQAFAPLLRSSSDREDDDRSSPRHKSAFDKIDVHQSAYGGIPVLDLRTDVSSDEKYNDG
jgi:hypothetical protein